MTLLVKDANTATQAISTQTDIAGSLVPVHAAAVIAGGVASPVSADAPMPVNPTSGAIAIDGSGTIVSATAAQTLFGGATPANGFQVANNSGGGTLYVNDAGSAAANVGMPVAPGAIYTTPVGYRPIGPISIFGGSSSGNFSARRW